MIEKLISEIKKKQAPIVVGLDPQLSFMPEHLLEKAVREYGETPEAVSHAIVHFNFAIIDAVAEYVPAVKPQIAMYERFGASGIMAFQRTVAYAQQKGLLVIGDVKRGDIGSTSTAYAEAHLGTVKIGMSEYSLFNEDFATVNPYLGSDGIEPFLKVCKSHDKGIFILVKTSNPSSGEFQDRKIGKKPLYELVAEKVAEWGEGLRKGDYSEVGAVVGATYPEVGKVLRKVMPHTYILVPGYGAQGGTAKDLAPYFNDDGLGAIVNSSRGIIAAYQQEKYERFGEDGFADAAREAVLEMKADLTQVLSR